MAAELAAARKAAGISQRALSKRLKHAHNYVYLVEKGERQISLCAFIEFALVAGGNPVEMVDHIVKASTPKQRRK